MYVAAEEFIDSCSETDPGLEADIILERFGKFLEDLETQPVTITITSLVCDMLELY